MTVSSDNKPVWSLPKLIGFRFLCVYALLYTFPFPLNYVPGLETWVYQLRGWVYNALVPVVGKNILGIDYEFTVRASGSGDMTHNFVWVFIMLVAAALGAALWSILDRKRGQYQTLAQWLMIGMRYYLAAMFLSYGFAKVIKIQFPDLSMLRLIQPFGHSSPMGLIWNMMGYSEPYNWFTGGGEVLAGLLLFFYRTRILGAMVGLGVMINVMALNYCFDIPVKLASTHYALMCVLLLLPDLDRLMTVILTHKAVEPKSERILSRNKKLTRAMLVLKLVFIGYAFYSSLSRNLEWQTKLAEMKDKKELGLYEILHYVVDGEVIAPDFTDEERYRYLAIEPWYMALVGSSHQKTYFSYEVDSAAKVLVVTDRSSGESTLWTFEDLGHQFIFEGRLGDSHVYMCTEKIQADDFLLINRGFNWVNEFPLNR